MLEARLWMKKKGKNYLGSGRIELLERIGEYGSIHAAAKAMKMSYKAAWDAVDAMNKLSETPLVQKTSGGRGGGGTLLTLEGKEVIKAFHALQNKHRQFLEVFGSSDDLAQIAQALSRLSLKLSARNQFSAVVSNITENNINIMLEMSIKGAQTLYASITRSSFADLHLKCHDPIMIILKAGAVFLSKTQPNDTYENILRGKIIQILSDQAGVEISLELPSGDTITATLSHETFATLNLHLQDDAFAFFKASSVIVGV
jgi:molybdate transport system regulatory protein